MTGKAENEAAFGGSARYGAGVVVPPNANVFYWVGWLPILLICMGLSLAFGTSAKDPSQTATLISVIAMQTMAASLSMRCVILVVDLESKPLAVLSGLACTGFTCLMLFFFCVADMLRLGY